MSADRVFPAFVAGTTGVAGHIAVINMHREPPELVVDQDGGHWMREASIFHGWTYARVDPTPGVYEPVS